jgi:ribosomal-protein-alanine N-acetyltransferase
MRAAAPVYLRDKVALTQQEQRAMSAVLKDAPQLSPMRGVDLDEVMAIERAIYAIPGRAATSSIRCDAGYECRRPAAAARAVGYFVLMVARRKRTCSTCRSRAVAARGHGSGAASRAADLARRRGARNVSRGAPEQRGAQALYTRFGFRRSALRRGYYPAHCGREDAIVLTLPLK